VRGQGLEEPGCERSGGGADPKGGSGLRGTALASSAENGGRQQGRGTAGR